MEEVIKLFKQIKETNSLNKKKAIIIANKNNVVFRKCLRFLLDGNIVTGISTKKINKNTSQVSIFSSSYLSMSSTFEDVIDYLEKNNTGRDSDIDEIQVFLAGHEEDRNFYEQMITKKFRLGIDSKIVNKCIPRLIPTFDVMLGTPIEKVKLKGDEWISISRKLNGTRCCFVGDKIMTRQGKEYTGLEHIVKDLQKLVGKNMFVDGELLYRNEEGLSDSEAFQKGTGIAMSKNTDKTSLKFVVFDMFPLEEFMDGKSALPYSYRKHYYLDELKREIVRLGTINVEIVPICYEGTDHTEIWKWLDYAEKNDWEGLMINLDTPYECKRTKNLIKVKHFQNCDIKCIDVEEGSGRNEGKLGALVCDYKGFHVNIGSGFSDDNRKYFWQHPEDVVGKIISVKYKEETKNKDGGISIQFPVFESVRFDKDVPSYN